MGSGACRAGRLNSKAVGREKDCTASRLQRADQSKRGQRRGHLEGTAERPSGNLWEGLTSRWEAGFALYRSRYTLQTMLGAFDEPPSSRCDAKGRASGRKEPLLAKSVVEVSLISERDDCATRTRAVGLDAAERVVESATSLLWRAASLFTTTGGFVFLLGSLLAHISFWTGSASERISGISFWCEVVDGDEALPPVLRASNLCGVWSLVRRPVTLDAKTKGELCCESTVRRLRAVGAHPHVPCSAALSSSS